MMTVVKFTDGKDGKIAEIVLDPLATPEHVRDAMGLVRVMLAHGVTAAEIVRTKEAKREKD